MSLNILLDYDKLFFNIFNKKSISMKNKIMNLFCRSSKREATLEDEKKLNYISSHILKYLKHYLIIQFNDSIVL